MLSYTKNLTERSERILQFQFAVEFKLRSLIDKHRALLSWIFKRPPESFRQAIAR